jgi:transposase
VCGLIFATELVDRRNGIDGLSAVVEQVLKQDPHKGHLSVFVGKAHDKVKVLYWDQNGFVLYMKRLERGHFQMPVVGEQRTKVELQSEQLRVNGSNPHAQRQRQQARE